MDYSDAITEATNCWFDDAYTDSLTYNGTAVRGHVNFYASSPDGVLAEIMVKKSDVPSPAYRDVIIFEGVTYYAMGPEKEVIKEGDAVSWTIWISRDVKAQW